MIASGKYPKVSIVTPNYNGGKYLEQTIQSVISQGYPNLEYIIIDGGSTDNSVEIIKQYEDHLIYWESKPDNGLYHAIQKGFDRCTGEIMSWINSDDMYHPKALFVVAEIFDKFPEIRWLQGKPTIFDEDGRCVHVLPTKLWTRYDYYLAESGIFIQQESTFWKRSLWDEAGKYITTSLKYAGDYELWIRFFNLSALYFTEALIGGYRARSNDQFSVEHLKDYKNEVKELVRKWNLSKRDLKIIRRYKLLKRINNIVSKIKLINLNRFISRYKKKNFGYPPSIYFDRLSQSFQIKS